MEKEIESMDVYPYNHIVAIKGQSERMIPAALSADHMAGIHYVLSLLDDRERGILLQRYEDGKLRSEIAEYYDISPERVRQIESKACKKLQRFSNWCFIQYGVAGYLRKVSTSEYNRGYSVGYGLGYTDGVKDGKTGVSQSFGPDEVMNKPIEALDLPTRAHSCLVSLGCKRIADVVRIPGAKIATTPHLGKISANDIARALKRAGVGITAWDEYLL